MPANPDIMPSQNALPTESEPHARRPYRCGTRAVGEVLASLPKHPLSAPLHILAADLNLSAYGVNRALDGIAGDGVGVVRTFDGASIAPQSWGAAQEKGEAYWRANYENTPTA